MGGPTLTSAWRRRWLAAVLGAGALAGALAGPLAGSVPAFATQAEDAGDVIVVEGAGSKRPRADGGRATEFSLRLPEGASCPGDSANDGFRVQSFIVPGTDDPAALRYKSTSPEGEGRYALYDVATSPYVQGFTAEAEAPGQPGLIVNVPTFSFAVFPPGELGEGPHHVGIACTLINETVRFWDTEMVLTRAPDDPPAEIRWRAPASVGARDDRSSVVPLGVVVAVLLSAAIAVVVVRRRKARRTPVPSEDR